MKKNIKSLFSKITEYWSPVTVDKVDAYAIKIAKVKGEFPWHSHQSQDELFFIIKGTLILRFRDREIILEENECFSVKKGIEHSPFAPEETWIMLFESDETKQYGG